MEKWPEKDAIEVWEEEGITFSIVKNDQLYMKHYCGYCRFKERPVIGDGYRGIMTYVPVHGGITLANADDDGGMVYGFDCAHSGDADNPQTRNLDWLRGQCELMAKAIFIAAWYEPAYLLEKSNDQRALLLDNYHKQLLEQCGLDEMEARNFGVNINLLFRQL